MPNIFHQILIQASRATVYEAITTPEGLAGWWVPNVKAQPQEGFVNEFSTPEGTNYMRVVQLRPDRRVEWECLNLDDAWTGTRVVFELDDHGDFTRLNFRHNGYAEEDDLYATCNFHWARHLMLLKTLCETGRTALDPQEEQRQRDAVFLGRATG